MKQISNVPFPEDYTPRTADQWLDIIAGPYPKYIFCPQGSHMVQKDDFDPRAGMCGACINEAMAEAPEYFGHRGLVASQEENESRD